MANNELKPTPTTYYDIEVSQETYDAMKHAARVMSQIINGDLTAVVDYALDAYRRRTNGGVPQEIDHNIRECARGLSTWGWNRPLSLPRPTEQSKIYNDLFRVLDVQQIILGGFDIADIEPQHDAAAPLPRIRCVYQSTQARLKQLRVFSEKITNKKNR